MKKSFLLLFFVPFFALGQNNDSVMIKKIVNEVMVNGKAYDLLRELTKKIGGRLAGSPQQQNAAIWGKKNMEAFGPDKIFFNPVKHQIGKEEVRILLL